MGGERDTFLSLGNFAGGSGRFFATLSPEQALVNERRPPGSLQRAVFLAETRFRRHKIITCFKDVPWEPFFPWQMFEMMMFREPCVLVAFMFKYHEHVMRHGVYLKVCNIHFYNTILKLTLSDWWRQKNRSF